jgi:hypothetical protein
LPGGGLGRRDFFELQDFGATKLMNENGFHCPLQGKNLASKKAASSNVIQKD